MVYQISEEDKSKIIALISVLLPKVKIYLFGSRAKGTNREFSDIDLALDNGEPIEKLTMVEIKDIMDATNLPYVVEVVDLNEISHGFRNDIEKYKVLWDR